MKLLEFAKNNIIILDGAMGTMLQNGFSPFDVHAAYLEAGANMILTNTFDDNSDENIALSVKAAKDAAASYGAFVGLDIAPTGHLLEPMGTFNFNDAYEIFKRQVLAGSKAGVDAIYIETMTDLYEAKCAVLAAKENCDLPVFCTMSFEKNMRTFTGTDISSMALTLTGLGVDFLGINCSVGPTEMKEMAAELMKWTHLPIIIKPNAGLPTFENGKTVFDVTKDEFSKQMAEIMELNIAGLGGCCGTTPGFIQKLIPITKRKHPVHRKPNDISAVCSSSKTVVIDRVRIIGERINPTGKKRFGQAILNNDLDYIATQAIEQIKAGADILDVNVGMPKIDESAVMERVVKHIQSIVLEPLQIDSSNPKAIEMGLRAYNGKAIVNSVNGKEESLHQILPLVKKYGATVVGLTLDENGIPKTAAERVKIAEKIIGTAISYGIPKCDIFIDCLTLTSGAEQAIAYETLDAVRMVKEELGVKTVLGVSNVSFGLPSREKMNQVFLALALANGLDLPIINPNDKVMVDTIYCYHQLRNTDDNSNEYIKRFTENVVREQPPNADISHYINNGLKDEIKAAVDDLLKVNQPLEVIQQFLIPSLDAVSQKYERGDIFLPQLLSSAETAKAAFDIVKTKIPKSNDAKSKIIIATVKGDIHDIGKNIVKVVLENYGYDVIDLGKDVKVDDVVTQVMKHKVKLVGLSALMTTTLDNMEKTIQAIKNKDGKVEIMVGGAVLNEQTANRIGADYYAKDAIEAVNIAKKVFS